MKKSICFLILLTACSTSPLVYETPNGNKQTTSYSSHETDAKNDALKDAKKHCDEQQQTLVLISETTEYQGLLEEETNKQVNAAYDITRQLFNNASLPGISSGDEYVCKLEFKCK